MDDLTAFITARLDEDEALARAAAERLPGPWVGAFKQVTSEPSASRIRVVADTENSDASHHIERWEPARVLREVAAKRAMVARHSRNPGTVFDSCDWCSHEAADYPWPCPDVRAIAAIWSDHGDYRAGWAG